MVKQRIERVTHLAPGRLAARKYNQSTKRNYFLGRKFSGRAVLLSQIRMREARDQIIAGMCTALGYHLLKHLARRSLCLRSLSRICRVQGIEHVTTELQSLIERHAEAAGDGVKRQRCEEAC